MFILAAERDPPNVNHQQLWEAYRAYVEERKAVFPAGAFRLATSDWYFSGWSHEGPHDAWLEHVVVAENPSTTNEQRSTSIHVRLLGAYHDGHIDLRYSDVRRFSIAGSDSSRGLGDWRYDEFRLGQEGQLVHEIEWWSIRGSTTWLIEATDLDYTWTPIGAKQAP